MCRVIKIIKGVFMMSVFSRAGAGIQNILSEWRRPASRSSLCVGSFRRESGHSIAPPCCLRQQGPTPADGPQRNFRPAGLPASPHDQRSAVQIKERIFGGKFIMRTYRPDGSSAHKNIITHKWRSLAKRYTPGGDPATGGRARWPSRPAGHHDAWTRRHQATCCTQDQ